MTPMFCPLPQPTLHNFGAEFDLTLELDKFAVHLLIQLDRDEDTEAKAHAYLVHHGAVAGDEAVGL